MQGNRRDKPTIEFDPEIEKTLKKNRSRVKAQRALQFDQEEANSEEGGSEKPFEEEDKATQWLDSQPDESITTWDDLVTKFLAKFFPP
ncbi:hypothetical protein PIB30_084043 [Stylosanthes scabra]|uniref:Retrotransposon gag domain-containing protein n=1 Tax=Stylosanthes scabra TaxID=79078 RepID=A0ABU6WV66_9FABA|nr:hypothetical protein [Stylosanthes scabra]